MVRFGVYLEHHAVPEWRDQVRVLVSLSATCIDHLSLSLQYISYARLARMLVPCAAAWRVRLESNQAPSAPVDVLVVEREAVDSGEQSQRLIESEAASRPSESDSAPSVLRQRSAAQAKSALSTLMRSTMEHAGKQIRQSSSDLPDGQQQASAAAGSASAAADIEFAEFMSRDNFLALVSRQYRFREDVVFLEQLHAELLKCDGASVHSTPLSERGIS